MIAKVFYYLILTNIDNYYIKYTALIFLNLTKEGDGYEKNGYFVGSIAYFIAFCHNYDCIRCGDCIKCGNIA